MTKYIIYFIMILSLLTGCKIMSLESRIELAAATIGYTTGKVANISNSTNFVKLVQILSNTIPDDGNFNKYWNLKIEEYCAKLSESGKLSESEIINIKLVGYSLVDGIEYLFNSNAEYRTNINYTKLAVLSFCNSFLVAIDSNTPIVGVSSDDSVYIYLKSLRDRRIYIWQK